MENQVNISIYQKISPAISESLCKNQILTSVLLRYGLTPTLISCITNFHRNLVQEIYNSRENTNIKKDAGHFYTASRILRRSQKEHTYYTYNQLLIAYCFFHRDDPSHSIDCEALLEAWNFVISSLSEEEKKDLNINALWYLIRNLLASLIEYDEADCCQLLYSNEHESFYCFAFQSIYNEKDSGYVELKSLKEVRKTLEKTQKQKLTA